MSAESREIAKHLHVIGERVRAIQAIDPEWRVPHIDDEQYELQIVEAGSTGIYVGSYIDGFGYSVHDEEDTYPSHPLLVRRVRKIEDDPYVQLLLRDKVANDIHEARPIDSTKDFGDMWAFVKECVVCGGVVFAVLAFIGFVKWCFGE